MPFAGLMPRTVRGDWPPEPSGAPRPAHDKRVVVVAETEKPASSFREPPACFFWGA